MTSRELVKRTLAFDSPERVPRQLWLLPWAESRYPEMLERIRRDFPDDIVSAPEAYRTPPHTTGNQYSVGTFTDEWGCAFENCQEGIIGEVKLPFLDTWDRLDEVLPPLELLTLDKGAVNAFCSMSDAYVIMPTFPRPFERLQFLRGTENLYCDLMYRPPELAALMGRLHEFFLSQLEVWAKTDVDALFFMDDWGSQQSLLIRPDTWRELFKPLYRDYVDIAHDYGKHAFMHSDGYIAEIIPDLIEIGLDALNSQIFCMGVDTLGARHRGRITFWGEIDRQRLLPSGTPEDIDRAVQSVREALWADGGVIAQCEFGPGANPDNVYRVFSAWNKHTRQL